MASPCTAPKTAPPASPASARRLSTAAVKLNDLHFFYLHIRFQVLGLIAIFPGSNVGLELAAVLMIATGQAWNMTFSFYYSLTSLPKDLEEASRVFRLGWWQRLRAWLGGAR